MSVIVRSKISVTFRRWIFGVGVVFRTGGVEIGARFRCCGGKLSLIVAP
jgi:hypothetical protein